MACLGTDTDAPIVTPMAATPNIAADHFSAVLGDRRGARTPSWRWAPVTDAANFTVISDGARRVLVRLVARGEVMGPKLRRVRCAAGDLRVEFWDATPVARPAAGTYGAFIGHTTRRRLLDKTGALASELGISDYAAEQAAAWCTQHADWQRRFNTLNR